MSSIQLSLGKAFIFSTSVLCLIMGFKYVAFLRHQSLGIEKSHQETLTPYYFVGSSRTQRGVNNQILNQAIPSIKCYNLGMGAMTLNYSEQVVLQLMESSQKKVIFMELSKIQPSPPIGFQYFCGYKGLQIGVARGIQHLMLQKPSKIISDMNNFLFCILSIKQDIVAFLSPQHLKLYEGHIESNVSYKGDDQIFVTSHHIPQQKPAFIYQNIIHHLLKKAEKSNTTLLFYLPITLGSVEEKNEILPVFHQLNKAHKIIYPQKLMDKITHSRYLSDPNHFNKEGAKIFSEYLVEVIQQMPTHSNH
jgi:hypothetical protein